MNSIYPLLPGTGTVLGHPEVGGTRRISFSIVGTLRSTLSPVLTNELRYGIAPGGNSIFREEISPALFSQWKGFVPAIGYVTNPYRACQPVAAQHACHHPYRQPHLGKSSHILAFGGSYTQTKSWQQTVGSSLFPTATFGISTTDPINTAARRSSIPSTSRIAPPPTAPTRPPCTPC